MERTHEEATKHYTPEEKVAILWRHLLEQAESSGRFVDSRLRVKLWGHCTRSPHIGSNRPEAR
jgi:hypothetical protein